MANASTDTLLLSIAGTTPVMALGLVDGSLVEADAAITGAVVDLTHSLGLPPFAAANANHFFFDFYNRIYVSPPQLNFGSISDDTTIVVDVWNAYLAPNSLASITTTGGADLAISGPALPRLFDTLEVVAYSVTASFEGPVNITGSFQFDFTNGSALLPAFGNRGVVWPFTMNWADGLRDQREFRTEILVSDAGKQQRRALRTTPRRVLEFTSHVDGARLRSLVRLLNKFQNKPVLMPDWVNHVATATEISPFSIAADLVQPPPAWMTVGAIVLLFDGNRHESRTISDVDGSTITFVGAGGAWPVGSRIYRALSGLLASEMTLNLPTNYVGTIEVTFEVEPGVANADVIEAAEVTHSGREVFARTPNWGDSVQSVFEFPFNAVDYGRGRVERFRPINFGTTTRRGTFVGIGREDVEALTGVFYRMKGQRGEFFMSSGLVDMELRTRWPASNANFRIVGREIASFYSASTVNQNLVIRLRNGSVYYRSALVISTISDALGDDTLIQLDTGIPLAVAPEDVLSISWLPRHRLGSDRLTIDWLTDQVAEISLAFVSLENLPGA